MASAELARVADLLSRAVCTYRVLKKKERHAKSAYITGRGGRKVSYRHYRGPLLAFLSLL